ncbi:MAG: glycosyltransferase family 39 protein [Nitrospinota bacterium]
MIVQKVYKNRLIILYLFIFAITIRGIYFYGFMDNPFFDFISPAFDQINFDKGAIGFASGDILARGGGEQYSPLYKYFLGIIYLIFGRNFYAIWSVQFFIGALSSVFMYLITVRLFNNRVAAICSLFYAMYGPNIFYEGKLIRESLTEFLSIISFYYLLRYKEDTGLRYAILSSAFLSLLVQCRPNTVLIFPFVLFYLYAVILRNLSIRLKIKHISIFLSFFILVGTPLMIRTVMVHNKFVFYDASGPKTILTGNLPEYSGVGWEDELDVVAVRNSINQDDYKEVVKYIFKRLYSSPVDYIKLYGRKIYWFFNNYEYPSNLNYYLFQEFSPVLKNPLGSFSLLVSLSFVGIFLTIRDYKKYLHLYFFIAGLILSVIIVYPTARFRITVVPFLMIFASYTIHNIFLMIYQKRLLLALAHIIPVSLIIFLLRIPDAYSYKIRPIDYNNMAGAYLENTRKLSAHKAEEYLMKSWNQCSEINNIRIKKGEHLLIKNIAEKSLLRLYLVLSQKSSADKNYKEGISYARRAAELDYSILKVHKLLSSFYHEERDYLNAAAELKICILIKPSDAGNYYNLAVLYSNYLKDYDKAVFYYQRALEIDPDIVKSNNSNWQELEGSIRNTSIQVQKKIEQRKKQIELLLNETSSALENRNYELAISNCKKVIDINCRNMAAHNYLAYAYEKSGRYKDSISEYIDILTINPVSAEIHYNLFELYNRFEKNNIKAMYHLEQSLKINPNQKDHEILNKKLYDLIFWAMNLRQISL